MRIFIFVFSLLVFHSQANAIAFLIMNARRDQAHILIQGPLDPHRLYHWLKVPADQDRATLRKEFSFQDATGTRALEGICTISKVVEDFASCTVSISLSKNADFGPSDKFISFVVKDPVEAKPLQDLFSFTPADAFETSDKKLRMGAGNSEFGPFGIFFVD